MFEHFLKDFFLESGELSQDVSSAFCLLLDVDIVWTLCQAQLRNYSDETSWGACAWSKCSDPRLVSLQVVITTYPCYCVYPERGEDHSFQLVDLATGYIMAISHAESMKPLGVAHFYHAFSVNPDCEDGPNFRAAVVMAFPWRF